MLVNWSPFIWAMEVDLDKVIRSKNPGLYRVLAWLQQVQRYQRKMKYLFRKRWKQNRVHELLARTRRIIQRYVN